MLKKKSLYGRRKIQQCRTPPQKHKKKKKQKNKKKKKKKRLGHDEKCIDRELDAMRMNGTQNVKAYGNMRTRIETRGELERKKNRGGLSENRGGYSASLALAVEDAQRKPIIKPRAKGEGGNGLNGEEHWHLLPGRQCKSQGARKIAS